MDGFSQGWSGARERSWSLTLPPPGEPEEVSGKPVSYFWLNSVGSIVLKRGKPAALFGNKALRDRFAIIGGIQSDTNLNIYIGELT